jgi:hypothetical protein
MASTMVPMLAVVFGICSGAAFIAGAPAVQRRRRRRHRQGWGKCSRFALASQI